MAMKKLVALGFAVLTVGVMSTSAFAHHHGSRYSSRYVATQCNTTACMVDGVCDGSCTGTGSCAYYGGCNSLCNGSQQCLDAGVCGGHHQYTTRSYYGYGHHGGCRY